MVCFRVKTPAASAFEEAVHKAGNAHLRRIGGIGLKASTSAPRRESQVNGIKAFRQRSPK